MTRFTLCKAERLYYTKLFEELLASKNSFVKYPLRIVYKESSEPGEFPTRFAVSVGKKRFKHAVDRNRIKRLIRESFRKHKPYLNDILGDRHLDLLFIFLDKEIPSYKTIDESIIKIIKKLSESFSPQEVKDENS